MTTLKAPKEDVVNIEKPLAHSFKDLNSEILLILFPIEVNKLDFELQLLVRDIFYKIKLIILLRKRKDPLTPQAISYLGKREAMIMDTPKQPY